jgi:hypothetical protein
MRLEAAYDPDFGSVNDKIVASDFTPNKFRRGNLRALSSAAVYVSRGI